MDINSYVRKLADTGRTATDFAATAGMSRMYLYHILKGRKPKPGLETILKLLRASDAEIKLQTLRPDLFPKGRKGREALELLRRASV